VNAALSADDGNKVYTLRFLQMDVGERAVRERSSERCVPAGWCCWFAHAAEGSCVKSRSAAERSEKENDAHSPLLLSKLLADHARCYLPDVWHS